MFFSAPPDTVKFGEVALQPPELTAKPRMSTSRDQVSRGGGVALFAPRCCLVQGTQVESTMFSLGLSYWAGLGSLLPPLLPESVPQPPSLSSSAWQEIADAEDAFKPWRCVPASDPLSGQTADRGGGERAGCERLQGAKETAAAAAGGSVTTATPPPFWEETKDAAVMVRDQRRCTWVGGRWADGLQSRVLSLAHILGLKWGRGLLFFLPKDCCFVSDHPPAPCLTQGVVCLLSPQRWGQCLGEMQPASFP